TSRPELAITLHADGHGVPGDKLGTYRALLRDLPEGIFMAWKNFYDEDTPMFTPEETFDVDPRPGSSRTSDAGGRTRAAMPCVGDRRPRRRGPRPGPQAARRCASTSPTGMLTAVTTSAARNSHSAHAGPRSP